MIWRIAQIAALIAWGWWAGFLWLAPVLAIVMELSHRVEWRWDFSDREFDRLTDVTTISIVAAVIYAVTTRGSHGVLLVVSWMPMLIFPLVAAQRFSHSGSVQLGSLFLSLRRRRGLGDVYAIKRVDLSATYLVLCLLAGGTAVPEDRFFFPVMALIAATAIFPQRSSRYPLWGWVLMLVLVLSGGFAGQYAIRVGQAHLEELVMYWLEDLISAQSDPSHLTTAIGHIGRLKFSDRILWQVRAEDPAMIPELLPRAMFQRYAFGGWSATNKQLEPVKRLDVGDGWQLGEQRAGAGQMELYISGSLPNGEGILPLPAGAKALHGLLTEEVEQNSLGTLVINGSPEFVGYRVDFDPLLTGDAPPEDADLELSSATMAMVRETAEKLHLAELPDDAALTAIKDFFADGFRYSLFRREMSYDIPPLSDFLLRSRKGHCEYFAASTVLLLRAAGIPSRYVSGFAVMEYSDLTESFLLRRRHAHAWAVAYIDGRWQEADFTPAIWAEEEQDTAPWWGGIADLWTMMNHAIQRSAMENRDEQDNTLYYIVVLILIAFLARRLYYRPKRVKVVGSDDLLNYPFQAGMDSPFVEVIQYFAGMDLGPARGETGHAWLSRLEKMQGSELDMDLLRQGLALHYRKRFNPVGLDEVAEHELGRVVGAVLRGVE